MRILGEVQPGVPTASLMRARAIVVALPDRVALSTGAPGSKGVASPKSQLRMELMVSANVCVKTEGEYASDLV